MPAGEITPRLICIEDLALTTEPAGEVVTANVLGLGPMTLNKVDMVRLSSFGSYSDDTAAAAGGVGLGFVYYNTTGGALKARMT